jgi:ribosomal protein S18
MAIVSGTMYRSLINGEEIDHERSVSFEPSEVVITIYASYEEYKAWVSRKGEVVTFGITGTDINDQRVINKVIFLAEYEKVVRLIIKLPLLSDLQEED